MEKTQGFIYTRRIQDEKLDQASTVRRIVTEDPPDSVTRGKVSRPRVLAVTSGKGGVGKTNIVANLAVSLSDIGKKVVVLDADFGLANIDVLLGLTPKFHLGHVLMGKKTLEEIMVEGPKGIRIIPASSGIQGLTDLTVEQRNYLVDGFVNLSSNMDFLIIDTAAGISHNVIHFLLSAHEVIVVSAPEPTAIVDAYAIIKIILAEDPEKDVRILLNSVRREEESLEVFHQINSVIKRFLNREVAYLGHIERDPHLPRAVRSQVLVTHKYPNAPASRCFRNLAWAITHQGGFSINIDDMAWEKLLNQWIN